MLCGMVFRIASPVTETVYRVQTYFSDEVPRSRLSHLVEEVDTILTWLSDSI